MMFHPLRRTLWTALPAIVPSGEFLLKMKILFTVAVLSIATLAYGADFETESWPGEGIPVFAAKNDTLLLHEEPSLTSPALTIKYKNGRRVVFDKSKLITKKSEMLTANKEITDL